MQVFPGETMLLIAPMYAGITHSRSIPLVIPAAARSWQTGLFRQALVGAIRFCWVLPLDMVENSISLSKPISGSFFRHDTVQIHHLLLEESSIRRLLLALSAISHGMLLQQHLA